MLFMGNILVIIFHNYRLNILNISSALSLIYRINLIFLFQLFERNCVD